MLSAIKSRIDEIQQEENWKNKIVDQWNEDDKNEKDAEKVAKKAVKLQKIEINMDNKSDVRSVAASENKSVVSERTHRKHIIRYIILTRDIESIQSIKEQIEKREKSKQDDWDKTVITNDTTEL